MALKIILAGATGWAGSALAAAIQQTVDLQLVVAVARQQAGQNLGTVLNIDGLNLTITSSVTEALATCTADVLIDYTHPNSVKDHVLSALQHKTHVVIGTSGLDDAEYADIHQLALRQQCGVVAAGNYAITAVLLQRLALFAARYLPHWEIIDYANASKPDAPSGTVKELVYRLRNEVHAPTIEYPVDATLGVIPTRGGNINGTQVHAVRLSGYVLGVETIFGMPDEKLILRHEAGNSATPYVNGTLLAARKVTSLVGLTRGLDNLLEF